MAAKAPHRYIQDLLFPALAQPLVGQIQHVITRDLVHKLHDSRAQKRHRRSSPQPAAYALTPGAMGRIVKDEQVLAGYIPASGIHPARLRESPCGAFCGCAVHLSCSLKSRVLRFFCCPESQLSPLASLRFVCCTSARSPAKTHISWHSAAGPFSWHICLLHGLSLHRTSNHSCQSLTHVFGCCDQDIAFGPLRAF